MKKDLYGKLVLLKGTFLHPRAEDVTPAIVCKVLQVINPIVLLLPYNSGHCFIVRKNDIAFVQSDDGERWIPL